MLRFLPSWTRRSSDLYIGIPLADNEDLVRLQRALKGLGVKAEYLEPSRLHVTLLYVDGGDLQKLNLGTLGWPIAFGMEGARIGTFDSESKPLVLFLDWSPALIRLQAELYDRAVAAGMKPSPYSAPRLFNPHVSLAYNVEEMPVELPGIWPIRLHASGINVTTGDFAVVSSTAFPTYLPDEPFVERADMAQGPTAMPRPATPNGFETITLHLVDNSEVEVAATSSDTLLMRLAEDVVGPSWWTADLGGLERRATDWRTRSAPSFVVPMDEETMAAAGISLPEGSARVMAAMLTRPQADKLVRYWAKAERSQITWLADRTGQPRSYDALQRLYIVEPIEEETPLELSLRVRENARDLAWKDAEKIGPLQIGPEAFAELPWIRYETEVALAIQRMPPDKALAVEAALSAIQGERRAVWRFLARKGISEAVTSPEMAERLGYFDAAAEKWRTLPESLWHLTAAYPSFVRKGLTSRFEAGRPLGAPGEPMAVTFKDHESSAMALDGILHEARLVASGKITADTLLTKAANGDGSDAPYLLEILKAQNGYDAYQAAKNWEAGAPMPPELRETNWYKNRFSDSPAVYPSEDPAIKRIDNTWTMYTSAFLKGRVQVNLNGLNREAVANTSRSDFAILRLERRPGRMGIMGSDGAWQAYGSDLFDVKLVYPEITPDAEAAMMKRADVEPAIDIGAGLSVSKAWLKPEREAIPVTRSEFSAILRGEPVLVGTLRRVVRLADGPFVIRHGKHIQQEGRPGEAGGSQPGYRHEGQIDKLGAKISAGAIAAIKLPDTGPASFQEALGQGLARAKVKWDAMRGLPEGARKRPGEKDLQYAIDFLLDEDLGIFEDIVAACEGNVIFEPFGKAEQDLYKVWTRYNFLERYLQKNNISPDAETAKLLETWKAFADQYNPSIRDPLTEEGQKGAVVDWTEEKEEMAREYLEPLRGDPLAYTTAGSLMMHGRLDRLHDRVSFAMNRVSEPINEGALSPEAAKSLLNTWSQRSMQEGTPEYAAAREHGETDEDVRWELQNEIWQSALANPQWIPPDMGKGEFGRLVQGINDDWRNTGESVGSVLLSEVVADKFGGNPMPRQRATDSHIKGDDPGDILDNDKNTAMTGRMVDRWYADTQRIMEEAGYGPNDTVLLYRGMSDLRGSWNPEARAGIAKVQMYSVSSWSSDPAIATRFAEGTTTTVAVVAAHVPVRDILANWRTGPPCRNEAEYIVIGRSPTDAMVVSRAKTGDRLPKTAGDVEAEVLASSWHKEYITKAEADDVLVLPIDRLEFGWLRRLAERFGLTADELDGIEMPEEGQPVQTKPKAEGKPKEEGKPKVEARAFPPKKTKTQPKEGKAEKVQAKGKPSTSERETKLEAWYAALEALRHITTGPVQRPYAHSVVERVSRPRRRYKGAPILEPEEEAKDGSGKDPWYQAYGGEVFTDDIRKVFADIDWNHCRAVAEYIYRRVVESRKPKEKPDGIEIEGLALGKDTFMVGLALLSKGTAPLSLQDMGAFIKVEAACVSAKGDAEELLFRIVQQAAREKAGLCVPVTDATENYYAALGMTIIEDQRRYAFWAPEEVKQMAAQVEGRDVSVSLSRPLFLYAFEGAYAETFPEKPTDDRPPPVSYDAIPWDQRYRWEDFNFKAWSTGEVWATEQLSEMAMGVEEQPLEGEEAGTINPEAIAYDAQRLYDGWMNGPKDPAAIALSEVVAETFGGVAIPRTLAAGSVEQWASEFGFEGVMGASTEAAWSGMRPEDQQAYLGDFAMYARQMRPEDLVLSLEDAANAIYTETQSRLVKAGFKGGDTVRLYRGVRRTPDQIVPGHDGGWASLSMWSISPWTFSRSLAANYATGAGAGTLVTADVPIEQVFCMWQTGPSSHAAMEYLVLGFGGLDAYLTRIEKGYTLAEIEKVELKVAAVETPKEETEIVAKAVPQESPKKPAEPEIAPEQRGTNGWRDWMSSNEFTRLFGRLVEALERIRFPAPVVNVKLPEQAAPTIHIQLPEQAPPTVNVAVPETNVTVQGAPIVMPPAQVTVNVPPFPRRMVERQVVTRSADKRITEITGEREYLDGEEENGR